MGFSDARSARMVPLASGTIGSLQERASNAMNWDHAITVRDIAIISAALGSSFILRRLCDASDALFGRFFTWLVVVGVVAFGIAWNELK